MVVLVVGSVRTVGAAGCTVDELGMKLDCTDARLLAIPDSLLSNMTTVIVLKNNQLTLVPTALLVAAPNLLYLDLTGNAITIISNDSFSTAPNLRTLVLDTNFYLSDIDVGAFVHLKNLWKLSISFTGLRTITRGHFTPLVSLRDLKFIFNDISSADLHVFVDLVNLLELEVGACGKLSNALATQSLGLTNLTTLHTLYAPCYALREPLTRSSRSQGRLLSPRMVIFIVNSYSWQERRLMSLAKARSEFISMPLYLQIVAEERPHDHPRMGEPSACAFEAVR